MDFGRALLPFAHVEEPSIKPSPRWVGYWPIQYIIGTQEEHYYSITKL
jgi:hypothetical protein